jgi:hypothetical protein
MREWKIMQDQSNPLAARRRLALKFCAPAAACAAVVGGIAPSASAVTYDRNAAVNYANQYYNKVVTDGYFWLAGDVDTLTYYGAGSAVPTNVSGEASGIGDDCAHFVSSCVGTPAGGLSIATRVSPSYGEPSAYRLDELLISDGYGVQVSSISQLTPGDVIGYDWDDSGKGSMSGIDHTVIYLGNNKIACHAASYDGTAWSESKSVGIFYIHMTVKDSIVPTAPANSSPASNASVSSSTPKLIASTFSDGAIGSTETAAEWEIYKGSTVVYDTGTDTTDLASLTVPDGELGVGNTYKWKVRYEDNYGDWSSYSPTTNFSMIAVPEPTSMAFLFGGAMLATRRKRR